MKKVAEIDNCFYSMLIEIETHYELSRGSRQEFNKVVGEHNRQVDTLKTNIEHLIQERLNS